MIDILTYKIKKYTHKLKHASNMDVAEKYSQKLQKYHRLNRAVIKLK